MNTDDRSTEEKLNIVARALAKLIDEHEELKKKAHETEVKTECVMAITVGVAKLAGIDRGEFMEMTEAAVDAAVALVNSRVKKTNVDPEEVAKEVAEAIAKAKENCND